MKLDPLFADYIKGATSPDCVCGDPWIVLITAEDEITCVLGPYETKATAESTMKICIDAGKLDSAYTITYLPLWRTG